MPRILTLILLCLLSLNGLADGLEFDSYSWDFGKILEKDGIVSHTFILTNTSKRNVQIASAIPSCSCTWVTHPKEVIRPGEKGEVEVKYTPSGAAGKVFRDIQIYDIDNKCIAMLEITADVEPADRSIPERYPYTLAPFLYTNLNNVPFGYVHHGTEKTKIIYLANSSDKALDISIQNPDSMLTLKYPQVLQPGEEAELEMTYHSPDRPDLYVSVTDSLRLSVNGEAALLPVVTTMIVLSRPETGEQAPVLRSYPSSPVLKKKGKRFMARLEISNDGDTDLLFHAIQLPPGTSASIQAGDSIAKGKKKVVEVTSAVQEDFKIILFSNDPNRPTKEIRVTGEKH